jgi:hypothetical protein
MCTIGNILYFHSVSSDGPYRSIRTNTGEAFPTKDGRWTLRSQCTWCNRKADFLVSASPQCFIQCNWPLPRLCCSTWRWKCGMSLTPQDNGGVNGIWRGLENAVPRADRNNVADFWLRVHDELHRVQHVHFVSLLSIASPYKPRSSSVRTGASTRQVVTCAVFWMSQPTYLSTIIIITSST